MEYEFIKTCFHKSPVYSSTVNLWKHSSTNAYYVSRDFREKNQSSTEPLSFRSFLTQPKQVTNLDFVYGFVEYGNTKWKL